MVSFSDREEEEAVFHQKFVTDLPIYRLPVFCTFSMVQSFGRETESKTWEVQF